MSIGATTLQVCPSFRGRPARPSGRRRPRFRAIMKGMAAPRYREELLLGTGGMAEVWLASGPLGRVAIKRLLPHAARNASLAAAFEREGRLLQRIRHPNVIGIHEVVRDEKGTSLVLEYVE